MKKFLAPLLVLTMMLSLQACEPEEEPTFPDGVAYSTEECLCEMTAPGDWKETENYEKADIEVTAPNNLSQAIVFHGDVPGGKKADFDAYIQNTLEGVQESTKSYELLSERDMTLDGLKARQFELETVSENQPITNLLTIIEGNNGKLYQILAWSVSSNYQNVYQKLHDITNTFTTRAATAQ